MSGLESAAARPLPSEGVAGQVSTFYVDDQLYGIDVGVVQEVTRAMPITPVPLAPRFIKGLINLRGQIATAISLHDLFEMEDEQSGPQDGAEGQPLANKKMEDMAHVVCRHDGHLIAFIVDSVSDVMDMDESHFEGTPETLPEGVARFLTGVYKLPNEILISLCVQKVIQVVGQTTKA